LRQSRVIFSAADRGLMPAGRARLATNPTGSIAVVMTIGIVRVACLAASAVGVVGTTMQSTRSPSGPAARPAASAVRATCGTPRQASVEAGEGVR